MNLYKVKIETEIMVVANSDNSAILTAKKNASSEIEMYGKGIASVVKSISEIPEDWKNIIPYSADGLSESRKCSEIIPSIIIPVIPVIRPPSPNREMPKEEIDKIIEIKNSSNNQSINIEMKSEKKTKPIKQEMNWNENKSIPEKPALRFLK